MWLAPGLCLVLTGILFANAACTNPRVRSEWHELTSDQQSAFVAACKDLAAKPDSNQFTVATQMSWHDFVVAHSDNVFWAHGNAEFYPFHRAMVWMFEEAIMATGRLPTGMGVPYFDWSVRSQTWASSNIFSAAAFGAPNSGDPDGCVLDGAFAKGRYNVASAGSTTQNRNIMTGDLTCLRRAANKEATLDAKFLQQELSASSYVQFTSQDPVNPSGDYSSNTYFDSFDFHGSGHIALGGNGADMSNPSISPNDPIFWLHHGFVDKHWWKWQKQCEQFLYDYFGQLASSDDLHNPNWDGVDNNAGVNMQLNAWPFIVAQMLDTQGNTLCYTYTELSTDLPPNTVPTCPSVKKLDTSGPLSGGETSATASSTSSSPAASSATTIQASTTATMHDGAVTPASNSGTYTTTSTIASLSNSSETIFQITNILVALIIQTKENKAALVNRRQNNNDPDYNTNEDDEVNIPNSNPKFRRIYNQDKSTTFIYTTHSRNITVPSTYTPTHVYNGHVVGRSIATGSLKRFYPESAVKPYIPDPDAPQNVTAGQSNCWLAPPPKVPRAYVEGMNKNWPRYETDYNRLLMQYDAFNKDNCTTQFSPSSLGNH